MSDKRSPEEDIRENTIQAPRRRKRASGERATLIVTNTIKIFGLILAVRTAFLPHPEPEVLALSAFMMAGAQFSESAIISFMSRWLGSDYFVDHDNGGRPPVREGEHP